MPLFYEVPMGSMDAYRAAVEGEHARCEEVWRGGVGKDVVGVVVEGRVGARGKSDGGVCVLNFGVQEHERRRAAAIAEAEALAEAGDDANAELSNDGGSQEDEPAFFTTEGSRISKKKRKKILKTSSIGSRGEGSVVDWRGWPWGSLYACGGMGGWVVVGVVDLVWQCIC